MSFLTPENLDLVEETKRNVEAEMKERVLDAIAIAHHGASELANKTIVDLSKEGASGVLTGIVASMLIIDTAARTAVAVAKCLDFNQAELGPKHMRARYDRLKTEGKVPA